MKMQQIMLILQQTTMNFPNKGVTTFFFYKMCSTSQLQFPQVYTNNSLAFEFKNKTKNRWGIYADWL